MRTPKCGSSRMSIYEISNRSSHLARHWNKFLRQKSPLVQRHKRKDLIVRIVLVHYLKQVSYWWMQLCKHAVCVFCVSACVATPAVLADIHLQMVTQFELVVACVHILHQPYMYSGGRVDGERLWAHQKHLCLFNNGFVLRQVKNETKRVPLTLTRIAWHALIGAGEQCCKFTRNGKVYFYRSVPLPRWSPSHPSLTSISCLSGSMSTDRYLISDPYHSTATRLTTAYIHTYTRLYTKYLYILCMCVWMTTYTCWNENVCKYVCTRSCMCLYI